MILQHEFLRPLANSITINHRSPILLLGSCFSESIADHLKNGGFDVLSNPLGVIFHPIPLARFICESIEPDKERILQREDVFLSRDASSEVYAMSEEELNNKLTTIRTHFREKLCVAQTLIITFGSAHGYRLKTSREIVANCHKESQRQFEKELTELPELTAIWSKTVERLKVINPALKIVFTVSPVRYSRDGWSENNRSKARLFELVNTLESKFSTHYFPAYEIVNDLLRDYRYFEKDGVHPNALAVEEVWEVVKDWYMDPETLELVNQMNDLRQMEQHRILFPESTASKKFLENFHKKRESFLSLHSYITW